MHRRKFLHAGLLSSTIGLGSKYFFPQKAMAASRREDGFIINSGIGGNNTVDLLARIDKDCLAHRPDLTILMIGTNDMNSMKHVPLPAYEENLRKIVSQILDVQSQVLLMTILPGYEPYLYTRHRQAFYEPEGYAKRNSQVNEVIMKVAADNKQPVLDMHYIFDKIGHVGEDADSLIQNEANSKKTDGIHPTPEGYRTMAVAIFECISEKALPHHRVVCFGDSITHGGGGLSGKSYPAYLKRLLGY
jgi:lysophospholipase L1-like esterase